MSEEELFREYISLSDDLFYLSGKVIPGAQKTSLVEKMDDGETWKFRVAAPPEKGKANTELVRYLKKEFGIQAEVISGKSSREKLLKCQK
jgi:uncharacterized protein (TIGR00251 family)